MPYKVKFLDAAVKAYDSIMTYLSQFYPSTPKSFRTALKKCEQNLKDNPYMYPVYDDRPIFRKAVVQKYILLYTVDDENYLVKIHHIIPGVWDISKHIEVK
ncbi:hypothetical protein AGMMS50212_10890 [Spirochaetia bacterium]|nr:hypothetical protein AGMMS50212_10890 [Spirochaetia bacterium]